MRRLLLALLLLAAPQAWGAIAYVGGDAKDCSGTTTNTCTLTYTSSANNTIVVLTTHWYNPGAGGVTASVSDSNAASYSSAITVDESTDEIRASAFYRLSAASATTFTLTTSGSAQLYSGLIVMEFSGVAAVGNTGSWQNGGTASSTVGPVSVTIQEANNFIAGGLFCSNYSNPFTSTTSGTYRCGMRTNLEECNPINTSGVGGMSASNTSASTGSLSLQSTYGVATRGAAAAIELCLSNPCSGGGGPTGPVHSGMTGFWGSLRPPPARLDALPPRREEGPRCWPS